jgi:glycolate oxidase FAD binding subunit
LAVNLSGPRRYGFGTLRDYVIGITVVNADGHEVKAGGRVVKNVAGYDLCKLHIGALGTLGIITQVTLKLKPRPESHALLTLGCAAAELAGLLDTMHASRTRPVCLDLLNAAAVSYINRQIDRALPDTAWVMIVGYEDNRAAVAWQMEQLKKEMARHSSRTLDVWEESSANTLWQALSEFPVLPQAELVFKANLLPSALVAFCQHTAALPERVVLHGHAGNGILSGYVEGELTLERAQMLLRTWQELAGAAQGNLIVRRCPSAWKTQLPVWGLARGDTALMRVIKEKLDPRGLFNPGRFVV